MDDMVAKILENLIKYLTIIALMLEIRDKLDK